MKARNAILLVASLVLCGAAAGANVPAVRVYLPRTVLVSSDSLSLGAISVIRCGDEQLTKKAAAVGMGRAPWPKERITFDRRTILSRLASAGIRASQVNITGAEKVSVGRDEKVIRPEEILKAAGELLEKDRPGPTGCRWRPSGGPADLVVPSAGDVQLKARLLKDAPSGYVKVRVTAAADGGTLAVRDVMYKLVYPTRQAVTTKEVPPGAVISEKNAKVDTVMVERRPATDWTAPFGMIATRPLAPGTVIRPPLVREAKPALAVRRNQTVLMRIDGFGFTVTAVGQALQDGRCGEFIKVRNVDTRRTVTAKVRFDGTVEPILKR